MTSPSGTGRLLFSDDVGGVVPSPSPKSSVTISSEADAPAQHVLSRFEAIITSYPPILESFLAQIPTSAIFDLYHTSKHLRDFLRKYPLAWKTLSFRLPQPTLASGSPGNETPENGPRQSKQYALDGLLKYVVQPYGACLKSLDLCNTAVSGIALVASVLTPRVDTLQHLSVRGCKNVSIKYHIVPFLEPYTQKDSPWSSKDLALRSLYTYRCRHHRRRPYLPSSLLRRDSDTDPTHQLIEICHKLGIWTDTAWCPTPGGRCYRRKDYHQGRAGPGNMEVWVPFDRLWRSSNRVGPMEDSSPIGPADGRLWEICETGQDGEPLGPEDSQFKGEGKHVPAHLRRSHTIFIDNVHCTQCNDIILERCESCSVRMHCMGCRKTLCASCAFNRPIPRKRPKTRHFTSLAFGTGTIFGSSMSQTPSSSSSLADARTQKEPPADRFWWAPGATRSPNLMNELSHDEDDSDSEDGNPNVGLTAQSASPPKLNMHWCCLEPMFSGGGGIAVLGTGLSGKGADKIRAAPLPRQKQFDDPDFVNQLRTVDYIRDLKNNGLYEYVLGEDLDILSYLRQDSLELQAQTCPRSLCQDCYRSFRWKVSCTGCRKPLCKEHDFRGLKVRRCGFRDLQVEREYARTHWNDPRRLEIPAFKKDSSRLQEGGLQLPAANASISPQQEPSLALSSTSLEPSDSDSAPLSQSQILVSPSAPTFAPQPTAPASNSPQPSAGPSSSTGSTPAPPHPRSSARPRSLSVSGMPKRNGPMWTTASSRNAASIANPLPLPCHPRHPVQWEGCGAYFCQLPRPVGDGRTRCTSNLRECLDCHVIVCDDCFRGQPRCPCQFCLNNYYCPYCNQKPQVKVLCRLEEEQRLQKANDIKAKEELEREKELRELADQTAATAGEFWEFWEAMNALNDFEQAAAQQQNYPAVAPENPSDQITVTTEFGVAHEPSNVTVISAGGPFGGMQNGHQSPPGESSSSTSVPDDTPDANSATFVNLTFGGMVADEDDEVEEFEFDDGDDVDADEDDLDAESAFIDEFLDPVDTSPVSGGH